MKNIILLLAVMFCSVVAFGQIKVVGPSGDVKIGDTGVDPLGKFHVDDNGSKLVIKDSESSIVRLVDITGGDNGSIRVGSINTASNTFHGAAFQAWSDNATNFKGKFFFDAGTDPGAGIFFRTSATTRMLIKQNGNVGIGNGSPQEALDVSGNIIASGSITPSDKRLKSDVTKFKLGLDEVLQLNPVNFKYNGKGNTISGDQHIGLIAQELREVVPSLVNEYTYEDVEEATLSEDYKIKATDNFLAIKESELKYLLINAIKEQQKDLDQKDALILELQERMDLIENKLEEIVNQGSVSNQIIKLNNAGLEQNIPNPFNEKTSIDYTVPSNSKDSQIIIYNMAGQIIKSVEVAKGKGSLLLDANELPAGTYSYNLIIDGKVISSKKMVLTK